MDAERPTFGRLCKEMAGSAWLILRLQFGKMDAEEAMGVVRAQAERLGDRESAARLSEFQQREAAWKRETELLRQIRDESADPPGRLREYVLEHPESTWGRTYLAHALERSGDLEGALEMWRELAANPAFAPINRGAECEIGRVLRLQGHPEAAVAQLRRYIQEDKEGHLECIARFHLADALLDLGDRDGAAECLREVCRLDKTRIAAREARKRLRGIRA